MIKLNYNSTGSTIEISKIPDHSVFWGKYGTEEGLMFKGVSVVLRILSNGTFEFFPNIGDKNNLFINNYHQVNLNIEVL